MKQVDTRISAHVRLEVTTLCTCWELVRLDGVTRRWTDHDEAVTVGSNVYESASSGGFDAAAIESSLGMEVANTEMVGFIGTGLDRNDLDAGLYDGARLTVMRVNWADPTMAAITMRSGTLGEVTVASDNMYKVELRGLQQPFTQIVGENYSPECRANFCDARCGLNIADYTASAQVLAVTSRKVFMLATVAGAVDPVSTLVTAKPIPAGQWNYGVVKFTTGANAGKTIEIKTITSAPDTSTPPTMYLQVELKFAVPNVIAAGDTLEVVAGCDHHFETCKAYNNAVNFRGEPHVPGQNAVFKILAV